MYSYPDLTQSLRDFQKAGLAISPWLAGVNDTARFDALVFEKLDSVAREITANHWTEEKSLNLYGDLPIPQRLPRTAIYETLASTAVFQGQERCGYTVAEAQDVQKAIDITRGFIEKHGFGALLQVYGLITSYENQSALAYYGGMPEKEFTFGSWHRPWIDYSLSDELLLGMFMGNYQVGLRDGRRYVELTDKGLVALKSTSKMLEESGYLAYRIQLLHISQFNLFTDYENLAGEIWPNMMDLRRRLLDWAGIEPGMKVLELGCASGTFTFGGGLAGRVGPNGRVVAVDPSAGMLARAEKARRDMGASWVDFCQCRAEELPFANEMFDAVIGFNFMHFTNLENTTREMVRVVKSGGIVATAHPLKVALGVPFFIEWFAPILEIAARSQRPPKDYLLVRGQVETGLAAAGLTEVVATLSPYTALFQDPHKTVQHFIKGVGLFQEELADLPWKAREEVVEAVIANGIEVCKKYRAEDLIMFGDIEMVKGRRLQAT